MESILHQNRFTLPVVDSKRSTVHSLSIMKKVLRLGICSQVSGIFLFISLGLFTTLQAATYTEGNNNEAAFPYGFNVSNISPGPNPGVPSVQQHRGGSVTVTPATLPGAPITSASQQIFTDLQGGYSFSNGFLTSSAGPGQALVGCRGSGIGGNGVITVFTQDGDQYQVLIGGVNYTGGSEVLGGAVIVPANASEFGVYIFKAASSQCALGLVKTTSPITGMSETSGSLLMSAYNGGGGFVEIPRYPEGVLGASRLSRVNGDVQLQWYVE